MLQIDLSGKIAVVTGATGELGRVITRTLADCGADVAIHFHSNQSKAQTLCEELSTPSTRAMIVQADVSSQVAARLRRKRDDCDLRKRQNTKNTKNSQRTQREKKETTFTPLLFVVSFAVPLCRFSLCSS